MREDIVGGGVFPDYELTDHTGKRRELSELQGPDPMILVLSRGGYCPKDLRQAEGLVQLHHEMEVGYSRLVTISTDNMLCFDHVTFDDIVVPTFRRVVKRRTDGPAIHGPTAVLILISDVSLT